jgi:hypothetical protein
LHRYDQAQKFPLLYPKKKDGDSSSSKPYRFDRILADVPCSGGAVQVVNPVVTHSLLKRLDSTLETMKWKTRFQSLLLSQMGRLVPLRGGDGTLRKSPDLWKKWWGCTCCESSCPHSLKSAWFQPLSLSSEKLVSKFAFKCNLHRYEVVARQRCGPAQPAAGDRHARRAPAESGRPPGVQHVLAQPAGGRGGAAQLLNAVDP